MAEVPRALRLRDLGRHTGAPHPASDVLRVLEPFWTTRPETARRVRQRIRAVLAWAQAHGYIDNNPADSRIDPALPPMPKVKAHHRALHYRDVPTALATIDASGASTAAKLCLRFVVLTVTRSGEARGARWSEIDDDTRQWRLPGERTKTGAELRVPLSDQAVAVLRQARALDDGSGLVFPSPAKPGHPLSDMALTKVLRDNGLAEKATVHGFRSSFKTWSPRSDRHAHGRRGDGNGPHRRRQRRTGLHPNRPLRKTSPTHASLGNPRHWTLTHAYSDAIPGTLA